MMTLMHGNDWTGQDVTGWWATEKFNGWRVLWDGSRYITRSGASLNVPESWRAGMPAFALDGELWAGRGEDNNTVHKLVAAGKWGRLRFAVIDVPGSKWESAAQSISSTRLPKHCHKPEFWTVDGIESARSLMQWVVGGGGEGIMLRKPWTDYLPYRNDNLLKLKP